MENGVRIKIISGMVGDARGPVGDIVINPQYLDIQVPAHCRYEHPTPRAHNVFAYVIGGRGWFGPQMDLPEQPEPMMGNETLIHYGGGEHVSIGTETEMVRFLLISGRPLNEPVAWQGPIVMNTQEELRLAFEEYAKGNFIKH